MHKVLEGVKVIDLSQWAAVPIAARFLGDLGADVIHIEHPTRGDAMRSLQARLVIQGDMPPVDINALWENYNRNKRGITLDVSKKKGQEILFRMLSTADVFLNNMRPFEVIKYGIDYAALKEKFPALIYGNLTGLGQKGPEKDLPGLDTTTYWMRGGIPHGVSQPGISIPAYAPGGFGDNMAGMALALGVMTALYDREKTHMGQEIYISLLQMGVFQLSFELAATLVTGKDCTEWRHKPPQDVLEKAEEATACLWDCERKRHLNALSKQYKTRDGRVIQLVMVQSDLYWSSFCRVIHKEELEHDPRFTTFDARVENSETLTNIIDEVMATRLFDEWAEIFVKARIPFGYYQTYAEVVKDRQAQANSFFPEFDHPNYGKIKLIANPLNLSETPAAIYQPAPEFSQHTEEVLLSCGYSWDDINVFKDEGLIA